MKKITNICSYTSGKINGFKNFLTQKNMEIINYFTKMSIFLLMIFNIIGCREECEVPECPSIQIPSDYIWIYENTCLEYKTELFDSLGILRISNLEGLDPFLGCLNEFPGIDFDTHFILVARIQTQNIAIVEEQRFYKSCNKDHFLEVEVRLTDFTLLSTILLFSKIPNDLIDIPIKVETVTIKQ